MGGLAREVVAQHTKGKKLTAVSLISAARAVDEGVADPVFGDAHVVALAGGVALRALGCVAATDRESACIHLS